MVHFYRPGKRTGDALAPCLDCGDSPTAPGFAEMHEPSRYPMADHRLACDCPGCRARRNADRQKAEG